MRGKNNDSFPPYLSRAEYFHVTFVISIVEIIVIIRDRHLVSLPEYLVNVDVEAGVIAIITAVMLDLIKVVAGVLYLTIKERFQPLG